MLLMYFNFPFCFICTLFRVHECMSKRCIAQHDEAMCTQKNLSATVKRFFCFCFSNVVYFFVHYLLPNLVLLTPLVNEPEGLVIFFFFFIKATSKLFSFFGKSTLFCVCVLHYFIIATSSHAFFFFFFKS